MDRTDLVWSRLIPLTKEELEKLPVVAGAFRISEKSTDGKYYVIFVGSSSDIKGKLLEIISDEYNDLTLKSYLKSGKEFAFRYVGEIDDENLRSAIEKQMYKRYAPGFNKQEPISSLDIRVNLS